jgi:hypothetical protein
MEIEKVTDGPVTMTGLVFKLKKWPTYHRDHPEQFSSDLASVLDQIQDCLSANQRLGIAAFNA